WRWPLASHAMARCFRARWPSEWLPGSSWHSCRLLRVVSSAIPNAPERRLNPPHPVAPRRSGGRRATAGPLGSRRPSGAEVLERLPDQVGDDLGRLDRGARVAHHAERDLFVRPVLPEEREVLAAGRRALQRDDVGVGLEQMRERALVGWALPVERLLVRVAP